MVFGPCRFVVVGLPSLSYSGEHKNVQVCCLLPVGWLGHRAAKKFPDQTPESATTTHELARISDDSNRHVRAG